MNQIAIIVPVFNTVAYLRRCVGSLLGQTVGVDIVLVDDGSTDGSGVLCDELSGSPGVHVIHRPNGGLSAARNTGIDWTLANSPAEYLAFVDSDDWVAPHFAESLLKGCRTANCRVAAAAVAQTEGTLAFPAGAPKFEAFDVASYWRRSDLLFSIACAKLFHRSLFEGVRFPEGRLHEDEFTTYRLVFQERRIAVCETPLYAYFRHAGSITRTVWSDRRLDAVDGLRGAIAFFGEKGFVELVGCERLRLVSTALNLLRQAEREPSARTAACRLRHLLREEAAAIPTLDPALSRRLEAALHPWRSNTIRFLKSISRYGLAEAVRLARSGWARHPQGIGLVAWLRFGLRNPCRLAGDAQKVEIVLTMPWGGGAAMYLEKRLSEAPDTLTTFVVRPVLGEGGRLTCEAYRGGRGLRKGLLRSLRDLECLAGRDVTVVVNELVQWHRYWPENVTDERVLEKTVDAVLALKQALSAGLTFLAHDYFCICPRWTLTRDDGVYCADEFACTSCGDCLKADDPAFMYRGGVSVFRWRQVFGRLLAAAEEVRVFSEDTQRRLLRVYPQLKTRCVPHVPNGPALRAPRLSKRPTVIGVFGPQTPSKGARQVAALADYLKKTGHADVRVVVVDRYVREELPDIVEREGINVAFFASVVPETFSYVTQELMMMQLPVVCFDLGAPAERIRKCGRGAVAKEMTAESVWQAILEVMK